MKWYDFRVTVGVPGTAIPLWSMFDDRYHSEEGNMPHVVRDLEIEAFENNADVVTIGGEHVSAALTTRQGRVLFPGRSLEVDNADLEKIWLDAVVAGDGVRVSFRGEPTRRGR